MRDWLKRVYGVLVDVLDHEQLVDWRYAVRPGPCGIVEVRLSLVRGDRKYALDNGLAVSCLSLANDWRGMVEVTVVGMVRQFEVVLDSDKATGESAPAGAAMVK